MKTGNDMQRAYAENVLLAIESERKRRTEEASGQRKKHAAEITTKVEGGSLLHRVKVVAYFIECCWRSVKCLR